MENIEVIPAALDQEPILAKLLELYIHDFSELFEVELGVDGRFGYDSLPLYWSEAGRHPFLAWVDGKLAGFVLVKRGSGGSDDEEVWDMAEFFVVRGCRRRGVGTAVAHAMWRRFPGRWEVRVMELNHAGHEFWKHAISAFKGEATRSVRVEKDGRWWRVFSFESGG